tara:strand:+ start:263 stop:1489 length:1227 start_codon:yes stop_codon:yes gene_type:complete
MIKLKTLDSYILLIMFLILPIDMLNGIFLKNGIVLPLSFGQFFKIIILLFVLVRLSIKPAKLIFVFASFSLLLAPTFYQLYIGNKGVSLLFDIIKISKYITPLVCFMFFVDVIKNDHQKNINLIFKLVNFSYLILIGNIFLKYIGLGYPMYEDGKIGSKGFFYAGNEISALLIILSSIIAYRLWMNNSKLKYFLFLLLNIVVGVTVSSKTAILGVIIVFLLLPIRGSFIKINIKKLLIIVSSVFVIIPSIIIYYWDYILKSSIFIRLNYFWNEVDILTFLLSNRNNFFNDAFNIYKKNYNLFEKTIGVGQSRYEYLNNNITVEIDIIDIFFSLGFIGLILFLLFNVYLFIQSINFKRTQINIYSGFVFLMGFILFIISTTAGHVYSSGMPAVFIGLLFSLMFIKKEKN